jgi:hypothetical protein
VLGYTTLCTISGGVGYLSFQKTSFGFGSSGSSDALSFSGNVFTITGGGNGVKLIGGDLIWNTSFPFGTTTICGAVDVYNNPQCGALDVTTTTAVAANSSGPAYPATSSLWKIPSGIHKRITSTTHNNIIQYWPFGIAMVCGADRMISPSVSTNCNGSQDDENIIELNFGGLFWSGDNTGASQTLANVYARDQLFDMADLGVVGSNHVGDNANSEDNNYARTAIMQNCPGLNGGTGQSLSIWSGMYVGFATGFCEPAGGGFVPIGAPHFGGLTGALWIGPQDGAPQDAMTFGNGNFTGPLKFSGGPQGPQEPSNFVLSSAIGSNIIGLTSSVPSFLTIGNVIWDVTHPSYIPHDTTVIGFQGQNIILSANLTGVITGDTISFNSGAQSNEGNIIGNPCISQQPGLGTTYTWAVDKACFGAGSAPLYLSYSGSGWGAWNFGIGNGSLNPTMLFLNSDYTGYLASSGGTELFYQGVEIGNGGSKGNERMLDAGASAFTNTVTSTTAIDKWTASSSTIELSSCTGFTTNNLTINDTTNGIIEATTNGCSSLPLLTLTGTASIASAGALDTLLYQAVSTTATSAFTTTNNTIPVTSCTTVAANQTVLDSTLSTPPTFIGTVASCTGTTLTLTAGTYAAAASSGSGDTLLFEVSFSAKDTFATSQTTIPVSTCTGVTGTIVDAAESYNTVGTESTCANNPRLTLKQAPFGASSGTTDALTASNRRAGDVRINTAPTSGGTMAWCNTSSTTSTGVRPCGPVSNSSTLLDYTAVVVRSGSSSNTDLTGRITLSGGTATYNLAGSYTSAPNCITADVTTPSNANSVSESTSTLTFTGTGTDVLKYICMGRN